MAQIILGIVSRLHLTMDDETALALGRASGGTPRQGKTLVLCFRDLQYKFGREPTAEEVLKECEISDDGLTAMQMQYLQCLDKVGGTAGLRTLVHHLRRHESVIMDYERLLVRNELVKYTDKGRKITQAGVRKIKGDAPRTYHHREPVLT